MSRRLTRIWLLPVLLLAGQALALGLGDIRLSSALNEPLRAEIDLLAAVPEELDHLTVQLASSETFERYGLDRPLYLTNLTFELFKSGTVSGNLIRVRSTSPISEPFVTFLVEATWSRGRLLREYTLLLDPPTFAPPPVAPSPAAVTAPTRSEQTDSGRIERRAPPPSPATTPRAATTSPIQAPVESAVPDTQAPPVADDFATPLPVKDVVPTPQTFDTTPGGDLLVERGDTLWGIASRIRPDSGLSMNQVMMALYEANPEAFGNNINLLNAGAVLRIPSADDIYRISRGDALSAVQRQHDAWGGSVSTGSSEPSLTLLPPDEDQAGVDDSYGASDLSYSREYEIEDRIQELEAEVPTQDSLIEIHDNELAQLRAELARIRGEEPPDLPLEDSVDDAADDSGVDPAADPVDDDMSPFEDELEGEDTDATDDAIAGDDPIFTDGAVDDSFADDDAPADTEIEDAEPPPVASRPESKPSLVDTVLGYVLSFWGAITGMVVAVIVILIWFARRAGRDDDDATGLWESLDADEFAGDDEQASTARLSALARDDDSSIVVVEQESKAAMAAEMAADRDGDMGDAQAIEPVIDPLAKTGTNQALEDTFSSETAINLDQSDPIAEADFHMAYGLHDQAAELIVGALEVEPTREDLLAKLCEVYFVWGNRDSFVAAAQNMKNAVGDVANAEWDKIIIMGQQIAEDHALFSGKTAGAAQAVDHSFETGLVELDMDLAGGPDGAVDHVIDMGADSDLDPAIEESAIRDSSDMDFLLDDVDTSASVTQEMPSDTMDSAMEEPSGDTAETEALADVTVESPTIEQQFESFDVTAEVPAAAEVESNFGANDATEIASLDDDMSASDHTAEINLDDLGLDLDSLADIDTAVIVESDLDATAETEALIVNDLDATGENVAVEEDLLVATDQNLALDLDVDSSLLDATGLTQVLSDDFMAEDAEEVISDLDQTMLASHLSDDDLLGKLPDDAETLLAPLDDDDAGYTKTQALPAQDSGDFDFAKTEALPPDVFTGDPSSGETGELPSLAGSTDLDLDLDDLTAALKVSEVGDTVNQMRDDATVEQPRYQPSDDLDLDVGADAGDDETPTEALTPDDVSRDLRDARTMTEVGTKLDLARAYVDMGDPTGAKSILEEVLDEGDEGQRQQAQQLLDSLPS